MMTATTTPVETDPTTAARLDALARIGIIRFPTRRDEAWRYAPHRQLAELSFGPPIRLFGDLPAALDEHIPTLNGPRIVVVNGSVDPDRSNLTTPNGLRLSTPADALVLVQQRPERSGSHDNGGLVDDGVLDDEVLDAYTALNVAFADGGTLIDVADGVALDEPIHIVDIAVPTRLQNASCTHTTIRLGAGSSATVVETRLGVGNDVGGSNVATTVSLGHDAALDHVLLQDVPAGLVHLSRVDVIQQARSTLRARSFNLGGSYGRLAYDVHLAGVGAQADLSGLFVGSGEQILDQQITVVHDAEDCTSRQSYRGVLDDDSTGIFNGGIDVRPGADGTDAAQSNDNLLLSNRAEINTQPRLEILADEVACKHGATVGQLDDTAMYYLRSRGIPADEARRLLINGFADQAVDEVGIDTVREWILDRLRHTDD
jgi:Fe-S cluster assembly protein SufD